MIIRMIVVKMVMIALIITTMMATKNKLFRKVSGGTGKALRASKRLPPRVQGNKNKVKSNNNNTDREINNDNDKTHKK